MAYDYLGLVNDVNAKLNEVPLTSSNFASATGFYSQAKAAVNSSIQDINQDYIEWPFNHIRDEITLTPGETRYAFSNDMKSVDMDSFRIKRDSALNNETVKLQIISYEDYLDKYIDQEYNTSTSIRGLPSYVFRAPNLEFGVVPAPDQSYELVYEYYRNTVDLLNYNDVPDIPETYRQVIVEGAMYYCYMFRSNEQAAALAKAKFEKGVKNMRTIVLNRYEYVRSTAIQSNKRYIAGSRIA